MQKANTAVVNGKKLQSYHKSQIMSLDPVQLLIKVYDYTILECKKGDVNRASKGLVELISALNFDYQEISLGLFRLYQYCLEKIKQREFDEAIEILEGVRDSWLNSSAVKKGGIREKTV